MEDGEQKRRLGRSRNSKGACQTFRRRSTATAWGATSPSRGAALRTACGGNYFSRRSDLHHGSFGPAVFQPPLDEKRKEEARGVLEKYDPKKGGYRRFIEGPTTPPRFSVLIGDAAHNFHSCLDHIAWTLGVAADPTGDLDDKWGVHGVAFPIFANRRKYLGKRHKLWRHVGLLGPHRRLVRAFQPYRRWDPPETSPLWHLRKLSNFDKHRELHTMLVGLDQTMPAPGTFTREVLDEETGEVEYIYELPPAGIGPSGSASMEVRLTIGGDSHGDVYFKGDLPFQIEIEQAGSVLHEQPVLRLMDGIKAEVESLLNDLTPLL